MRRLCYPIALLLLFIGSHHAYAQVIYDNGAQVVGTGTYGLVTHPGAGSGGADGSAVISPDSILGFGLNPTTLLRYSDEFTVPAGQIWTVTSLRAFAYQLNATTTPVTGGTLRFLNGSPNSGGTVIGGNTTNNVLTASVFSNIYRVTTSLLTANTRMIWDNTLTLGSPLVLTAGTYWADWNFTFSGGGVGMVPPISLTASAGVTGNSLQDNSGTYVPVVDTGSSLAKGMPFLLQGSIAVPEPTTLALLALGGIGSFVYYLQSRRRVLASLSKEVARNE